MHTIRTCIAAIAAACWLAACSASPPPAPAHTVQPPPPVDPAATPTVPPPDPAVAPPASPDAPQAPAFVGKVWKVVKSSDGSEPGQTYAFLPDGRLVIQSPRPADPPGRYQWRYDNGTLVITEDVPYPTEVVRADDDALVLRSHNPGGQVELTMQRLPGAALPK